MLNTPKLLALISASGVLLNTDQYWKILYDLKCSGQQTFRVTNVWVHQRFYITITDCHHMTICDGWKKKILPHIRRNLCSTEWESWMDHSLHCSLCAWWSRNVCRARPFLFQSSQVAVMQQNKHLLTLSRCGTDLSGGATIQISRATWLEAKKSPVDHMVLLNINLYAAFLWK